MHEVLKNAIAEELEVDSSELISTKVLNDLEAWDSVVALTIMVMIGDEVGIPVMPNEIKALQTFGDIEKLILFKQEQGLKFQAKEA